MSTGGSLPGQGDMAYTCCMQVWSLVLGAVALGGAAAALVHACVHDANAHQAALGCFLCLNVIVALWEICLFLRIGAIRARHERLKVDYHGRELDRALDFLRTPVPIARLFSPDLWSELWSSYALFDDSYADRRSFGFFIDVGNGFSTLVPSLVFLVGMTAPVLPARVLGIVGLLLFYQMAYGTLIYLMSYVLNRRWRGHPPVHVALFVGLSNGLWLVFPGWGIVVSVRMILDGTYAVVR